MDVGGDEIGDVGVDCDVGVEEGDLAAGGFGFGKGVAGVGLVEEDLTLEVGGFYKVAVDEGEGAYTGAGEERGGGCAGGSYADDGDVGVGEELLAGGADAGEEDLAGVTVSIRDGVIWDGLVWDDRIRDGLTGGGTIGAGVAGGVALDACWQALDGCGEMFGHDRSCSAKRRCSFVV